MFLVGVEKAPCRATCYGDELLEDLRIEEERRLMYVGITRARLSLHITWCQKRRRGRDFEHRQVSRFVKEMQQGIAHDKHHEKPEVQLTPQQRIALLKARLSKTPEKDERQPEILKMKDCDARLRRLTDLRTGLARRAQNQVAHNASDERSEQHGDF